MKTRIVLMVLLSMCLVWIGVVFSAEPPEGTVVEETVETVEEVEEAPTVKDLLVTDQRLLGSKLQQVEGQIIRTTQALENMKHTKSRVEGGLLALALTLKNIEIVEAKSEEPVEEKPNELTN